MATNRTTGVVTEVLTSGGTTSARVSAVITEVLIAASPAPVTIYSRDNLGGDGPRGSVYGLVSTLPRASGASGRPMAMLVNGDLGSSGKPYMTANTAASGKTLTFEVLGLPRVIVGYDWYQDPPVSPIEFAFDASNDGSTWTTLAAGNTMAGPGGSTPCTVLLKNTTAYKWYRLREVSGTWNDSNIWQVVFITNGTDDEKGNRLSTITTSTNITSASGTSVDNLVDGAYGRSSSDSWWPFSNTAASGLYISYQFTTPRVVKYARVESASYTGDMGTWKWQGSHDGTTWTDIGSSFTWNVSAWSSSETPTPVQDLSDNTTAYEYYRTLGVSGTFRTSPYLIETYFDIDSGGDVSFNLETSYVDEATFTAYLFTGVRVKASFTDDALLTAALTVSTTYQLSVSYSDGAEFRNRFLHVTPPVKLSCSFTDDAQFSATVFPEPELSDGPFYFAWVDSDDNQFNTSYLRNDEDIISIDLSQSEGDFAKLSVVVKNPRVGLLAPSRKIWAWLSYYDGVMVRPLMFGRLLGIPSNIFATTVKLEFIARPSNFAEQKMNLAATMRDAPFYDPMVISPDSWDDPDVVLEARTELWHIDRVTGEVTTSDIVVPEDGIVELTEDDHIYDGLSTSVASVPLRRVGVQCQIPFTQQASGVVSLTGRLQNKWPKLGFPETSAYEGYFVSSYTFEGLSGDWPRAGARLGQGWTVVTGSLVDQSLLSVPSMNIPDFVLEKAGYVNPFTDQDGNPVNTLPKYVVGSAIYVTDWQITNVGVHGVSIIYVPVGWGVPELVVSYEANRNFTETVMIDLETDTQSIMTAPGDDEIMEINISANSASDVTRDNSLPIVDVRRNAFVSTDRGLQLVEHLVLLARANLINRARAIKTVCRFKDFVRAFDVTLRKGLLIHDHRLPGQQVLGKITEYQISYSNGVPDARVTVCSTVGYGGSVATSDGVDVYIDDDYIDDYYVREGTIVAVASSDVTYTVPLYVPNDDGIDFLCGFNSDSAARSIHITGGPRVQRAALDDNVGIVPDINTFGVVLQNLPTQVHVNMVPIGKGPYSTDVPVIVSKLIVPKQIDLEADT